MPTVTKASAKTKNSAAKTPLAARAGKKAPATSPVDEPIWSKGSVKPAAAAKLHIELPDGAIASKTKAAELTSWPAVRLRVVFDAYSRWWGAQKTPWHDDAVRTAMELGAIVSPKWMVQDNIDRWDDPVLKPLPFSKDAATRYISKTLFATKPPRPWTVLRTGGELSVRYDASLLVLKSSLHLFLSPTPANVTLLEETLDKLARRPSFAYASVGYGLAGWASSLAVRVPVFFNLERKWPAMNADWRFLIGNRWRRTEAQGPIVARLEGDASRTFERRGSLQLISVPRAASPDDAQGTKPGKKLAADIGEVAKRLEDLERRGKS